MSFALFRLLICILFLYLLKQASHNGNAVRNAALEKEMIDTLTGERSRSHLLKGLLEEAATRQDAQIKEAVHMQKFFISFWMGDYQVAMKYSTLALETHRSDAQGPASIPCILQRTSIISSISKWPRRRVFE